MPSLSFTASRLGAHKELEKKKPLYKPLATRTAHSLQTVHSLYHSLSFVIAHAPSLVLVNKPPALHVAFPFTPSSRARCSIPVTGSPSRLCCPSAASQPRTSANAATSVPGPLPKSQDATECEFPVHPFPIACKACLASIEEEGQAQFTIRVTSC